MADETIIIEIKDGIDSSIATKIKAIATAARTAHSEITGFAREFDSLNKAAATISKLELANERLATAVHRSDSAALVAAQNEVRLTAARSAAAAAADKQALAAIRLADAQARVTERAAKAAQAQKAASDATKTQSQQFDRAGLSVKQYNAAMRGVPAQITDIVVSLQGGQKPLTVLLQQGGQLKDMFGGIRPAAAALGRSLLAMVNPFTLAAAAIGGFVTVSLIAESRLRELTGLANQFEGTGRVDIDKTFIGELQKTLMTLPGVSRSAANEIIGAFADIRTISKPIFEQASQQVSDLASAMGTDAPKAAKFLADALESPLKGAEKLDKQIGFLTVQQFKLIDSLVKSGRTAEAQQIILDSLNESIGGLSTKGMTPLQKATYDLGNAWDRFMRSLGNSSALSAVTTLLVKLVDGLTWTIEQLDKLFSMNIPPWLSTGLLAGAGGLAVAGPVGGIAGFAAGALGGAGASALGAGSGGSAAASGGAAGSNRTAAQSMDTDLKLKKAGLKPDAAAKAEENRATAIAKVTAQLQNELTLLEILGNEREKQEMFNRIEESFIGRKIKLTDEESAAIRNTIDRIVEMNMLSQERNRIYNESKGPLLEYNAALKAADELLADEIITQEQANSQKQAAEAAYNKLTNVLYEHSKAINDELQLQKYLGVAYQDQARLQALVIAGIEKKLPLSERQKQLALEDITAQRQRNELWAAENQLITESVGKRAAFITQLQAIKAAQADGSSGFSSGDAASASSGMLQSMGIDPSMMQVGLDAQAAMFQTYYDQIDAMRQAGLLKEEDAARAKAQIAAQQTSSQLGAAKGLFDNLAQLQNSGSEKAARLGKAAAIVQATINTYEGATKALAQGGIYGPILAATVVAAGLAQVANIRSQGYQEGGFTGWGNNSEEAGPVHKNEYVFDAQATRQIGVTNLDALRSGAVSLNDQASNTVMTYPVAHSEPANSSTSGGDQSSEAGPRIINVLDPAIVGDFFGTPSGEQIFVNMIRRNSDIVKSALNNG